MEAQPPAGLHTRSVGAFAELAKQQGISFFLCAVAAIVILGDIFEAPLRDISNTKYVASLAVGAFLALVGGSMRTIDAVMRHRRARATQGSADESGM